jgi:hypothetical protein
MKTLILSLLLVSQSAIAAWDDAEAPFNATKNQHKTITLSWVYTDDVQTACKNAFKKQGIAPLTYSVAACSIWQGSNCTIITKRNPTLGDVGHEVRHCYQYSWH